MKNKNLILFTLFTLLGIGLAITGSLLSYFCFAASIHYIIKLLFIKPNKLLFLALIPLTLTSCDKEDTINKQEPVKKTSQKINEKHLEVILNSSQYNQLGKPDLTNICLVENKGYPGVYQVLIETKDNEQATFLINNEQSYPVDPLIVTYEPDERFTTINGSVFSPNSNNPFSGNVIIKDLNGDIKQIYNVDNGQYHPVLGNSVRSCVEYLMSTLEFIALSIVNPWSALGSAVTSCLLFEALGWLD